MTHDYENTHGPIIVVGNTKTAYNVHGPVIVAPTTEEALQLIEKWGEAKAKIEAARR